MTIKSISTLMDLATLLAVDEGITPKCRIEIVKKRLGQLQDSQAGRNYLIPETNSTAETRTADQIFRGMETDVPVSDEYILKRLKQAEQPVTDKTPTFLQKYN